MKEHGKKSVLGVLVDPVNYEDAVERIIEAAKQRRGFAVAALAVHGVMEGFLDSEQRFRLNHLDLVVPDGQPVRWALNLLHNTNLSDRVYGPELMSRVCARAEEERLGIYLYGSTEGVIRALVESLRNTFPRLIISGAEPSKFRRVSTEEKKEITERIVASGARITFVGLGCPRQEVWAYEYREALPMPIIAVGAAFDFHAGTTPQAPKWMRDRGLEWAFRLWTEPRRLWRRYLLLNPLYLLQVTLQLLRLRRFDTQGRRPVGELLYG